MARTKEDVIETNKMIPILNEERDIVWADDDLWEYKCMRFGTVDIATVEFRTLRKTLVKLRGFRFCVHSEINQNGITGPDDIGRTRTVEIGLMGLYRGYNTKKGFNDFGTKNLIYKYFRSLEEFSERVSSIDRTDKNLIYEIEKSF